MKEPEHVVVSNSASRGNRYSDEYKQEVVKYADEHSISAAEYKYKLSQTTIRKWCKDERYQTPYKVCIHCTVYRILYKQLSSLCIL